jgi:hypothetical protein
VHKVRLASNVLGVDIFKYKPRNSVVTSTFISKTLHFAHRAHCALHATLTAIISLDRINELMFVM